MSSIKKYKIVKTISGEYYEETSDQDGITLEEIHNKKTLWNVDQISDDDVLKIINAIKELDYVLLIRIHNKYNLSGFNICSPSITPVTYNSVTYSNCNLVNAAALNIRQNHDPIKVCGCY